MKSKIKLDNRGDISDFRSLDLIKNSIEVKEVEGKWFVCRKKDGKKLVPFQPFLTHEYIKEINKQLNLKTHDKN